MVLPWERDWGAPQQAPAQSPISPALVERLIQAESGGRSDAVSPKGATGPAQIMPRTGQDPGFGVAPVKDPTDPVEARRFATDYLTALHGKYGNINDALAAYNWGPGNLDKYISGGRQPGTMPQETTDYIKRVTFPGPQPGESPPAGAKPWERNWTPPEAPPAADQTTAIGRMRARNAATDQERQRQEDMQNLSGTEHTGFWDQLALSWADNPKEARAILRDRYPGVRLKQTSDGTWFMEKGTLGKPDYRRIEFGSPSMLARLGAGFVADLPENVGALGGAIAGFGTGGPMGAVAGAGAGAGLGGQLKELGKNIAGVQRKDLGESMRGLQDDVLMGMAGEGAGRLITQTPTLLRRGFDWSTGVTPATRDITAQVLDRGGVPPVKSALPSARVAQFHERMSERLVGPWQEDRNLRFIEGELRDALRQSGLSPVERETAMLHITDPQAAIPTAQVGEATTQRVNSYLSGLEKTTKEEIRNAQMGIDRATVGLENRLSARRADEPFGEVGEAILQARKDFSTAASKIYKRVDNLVGDEKLVPTYVLRKEAQKIVESLPQTQNKTIIHEIAGLGDNISFADAQRLRTRLREAAESTDLTPGAVKHDFSRLETAINAGINGVRLGGSPEAQAAANMLRAADSFYADGIKKFNDATVNKLVRDIRAGAPPDATKIAETVLREGQSARVDMIRNLVGEKIWKRVQGADFENMMRDMMTLPEGGGPVTGIDGRKFLETVLGRGKQLDQIYGAKTAGEIRDLASKVAARDGVIDANTLTPDAIVDSLRKAQAAAVERETFLKENFLAKLADPKANKDNIYKMIVSPGNETYLRQAQKFFGDNSTEMTAVRQTALNKLLAESITTTQSGVGRTVSGDGLEKALQKYTKAQQEILFPNGLGDDLRLIAREAKFVFPEVEKDMAAGLAAGALKAGAPFTYPVIAYHGGIGWILSRPSVVRYLANGAREGGAAKKAAAEGLRGIFRAAALGTLQPGKERKEILPEDEEPPAP